MEHDIDIPYNDIHPSRFKAWVKVHKVTFLKILSWAVGGDSVKVVVVLDRKYEEIIGGG